RRNVFRARGDEMDSTARVRFPETHRASPKRDGGPPEDLLPQRLWSPRARRAHGIGSCWWCRHSRTPGGVLHFLPGSSSGRPLVRTSSNGVGPETYSRIFLTSAANRGSFRSGSKIGFTFT